MSSGSLYSGSMLHGFRRNERRLGRWALGLFVLVWLQLAAAPCRAVHAVPDDAPPATPASVHAHCDDPVPAAPEPPAGPDGQGGEPCPWCPPGDHAGECDGASRCAYPHGPQVDSRLPPPVLPSPVAASLPAQLLPAGPVLYTAERWPDAVPRRSYSVSYCRYLE